MNKSIPQLKGPYNQFSYFIAPNPSTSNLPQSIFPTIDFSAFIGPFSCVIGDVTIGENTWLGCNVVVKADQGTPFYIGKNTNIQDGVIIHAWANKYVKVNGKKYAVYIGDKVSCAHNCVVHGPCHIGDDSLVGINAVVINAYVSEGCLIGKGAVVAGGVFIDKDRYVPDGAVIDTQQKADELCKVSKSEIDKLQEVIYLNEQFPLAYSIKFDYLNNECSHNDRFC
ncbi:MAG: DapH/DapD/GlmU-related protein [Paraclostridium sp.]